MKRVLLVVAILMFTFSAQAKMVYPEPKSAPGIWSDGWHILDQNGIYWTKEEGTYVTEDTRFVHKYGWVHSDKATYMGAMAREEAYYKCLDRKVKGHESKAAMRAITQVCANKGKKAKRKAIRKHQ